MIEYDLKHLLAVMNWASDASDGQRGTVIDRNPIKKLPLPSEQNPKRPALSCE